MSETEDGSVEWSGHWRVTRQAPSNFDDGKTQTHSVRVYPGGMVRIHGTMPIADVLRCIEASKTPRSPALFGPANGPTR